jgi:RNA polymerase sporulation-specific sigma factor
MLQSYLEELRKTKLLEPKEEQLLWERVAEGDVEAHQKLMVAYQPLVFKLAIGFQLQESETMELVQEGMVGLLEAAENYDYTRGVAFSVFATFRIKGRMLDYLKKTNSGVLYLEGDLGSGLTLGETLASGQVSPTEYAERQLLHDKVTQALGRLPEKEQKVITGMYLEDRPAQAVAEAIDISLGHVYRLQKKGVRRIRGMLSRFIHDFNKS